VPTCLSSILFTPPSKGQQPPFGISKFAYRFDAIANMILVVEYKESFEKANGLECSCDDDECGEKAQSSSIGWCYNFLGKY
jgi:hypothetical protein